jgi:FkbM family methyltransferase
MQDLLSLFGAAPVLVDVGASAGPPAVWAPLAPVATYVGFDPDSRAIADSAAGGFRRSLIVNEAITSDPGAAEVRFFLTRSPYCSSTLEPDLASLSNYHFSELFVTERQAAVRAATLDAILARLGLDRIDWLKCDTQGTDLRIFRSLGDGVRRGVLALDIEPGLIDAYRGEDLFVDAQKHLAANGFWLSRLQVNGAVRVRSATLQSVFAGQADPAAFADRAIRKSPGWCEARYLRTLESLAEAGATRERYALLFVFSLLDEQPGFALDVALDYERRFGGDAWSARMRAEAVSRIVHAPRHAVAARARRWAGRIAKLLRAPEAR